MGNGGALAFLFLTHECAAGLEELSCWAFLNVTMYHEKKGNGVEMSIPIQRRPGLTSEQQASDISVISSSTKDKLSAEELYKEVARQNGKFNAGDVRSMIESAVEVLMGFVKKGMIVQIPGLVDITPVVGGTQDKEGNWLTGPHKRLRARVVKPVRDRFAREASLTMMPTVKRVPIITYVSDMHTGALNCELAVGHMVAIVGDFLKIHPLVGDEGVFFVKPDGTEVKSLRYRDNKPKRLTCEVPEGLVSGDTCQLKVRVRIRSNKVLRSTTFETPILIV